MEAADHAQWSWPSRRAALTLLLALRRSKTQLPAECTNLLVCFLLERPSRLVSWSACVSIRHSGRTACSWVSGVTYVRRTRGGYVTVGSGALAFSAQPLASSHEGRYVELHVDAVSGNDKCGLIMGITATEPGGSHGWADIQDIGSVPQCIWGLPRIRATSRFRMGSHIGYQATYDGDLVLYIDGKEVGRQLVPAVRGRQDLWLVLDLSHDVRQVTILDTNLPLPQRRFNPLRRSLWAASLQFSRLSSAVRKVGRSILSGVFENAQGRLETIGIEALLRQGRCCSRRWRPISEE
eukprot:TRINITY_DN76729_c0_g1_i1.p1 TRINITY_DN76729_c0_g1~~TRINITY_DN76729_c0_g1_i1.p1  ORF type:complete len:294 (+),score=13.90 TRINITY_DN76729_c0_g1_i1:168-1049(+)